MPKILFYIIIACLSVSCKNDEVQLKPIIKDTVFISDYNFIIAPDLSNRINPKIHPKALNDTILIGEIINNIESILDIDRKTNQIDRYKLDFINRGILNSGVVDAKDLTIDFSKFSGKPLDLSNYVRFNLAKDIGNFKKGVKRVYDFSLVNNNGSDIWNYLNETIKFSIARDEIRNITPDDSQPEDAVLIKKTENLLILLTDGYIENVNNTSGYTLNQSLVNKIRDEFKDSNTRDLRKFIYSNPDFHLHPTGHRLTDLNILVLELHDRSLDNNGVAKYHPTDFQIIKTIWEKWLMDSGAKSVSLHSSLNSKEDVYPLIENYIKNLK